MALHTSLTQETEHTSVNYIRRNCLTVQLILLVQCYLAVIDPPEGCRFGNHPSMAYFHDKQLCVVHGGAKVQVTGHCFTNTESILNIHKF